MEPYLTGEAKGLFDAWHATILARFSRDLTFPEIRKGVQALSSLYVAKRGKLEEGGAAAFDGAGKRAGFALYFAPIHFLIIYHAVREVGFDGLPISRLWDLGCGTGVGGAAWGLAQRTSEALAPVPGPVPAPGSDAETSPAAPAPAARAISGAPSLKIIGADRSGFALEEAEATYRHFGLKAEARRIDLGQGAGGGGTVMRIGRAPAGGDSDGSSRRKKPAGAMRGDDAVLLAFTLNEIGDAARERLLSELAGTEGTSRPLLVVEPVSRKIAPWWTRWERALGEEALSVHSLELRKRIELPAWIASMDDAAGLDHRELTARVLGVIG